MKMIKDAWQIEDKLNDITTCHFAEPVDWPFEVKTKGYFLDLPAIERLVNLMQDCDVSDDGISSTPHFDYKYTLPEALEIVKKECEEKE